MNKRCPWSEKSEVLKEYHDNNWGKLKRDDWLLFEALTLELMQAGLSFEIVLKKSEALKKAFCNWDVKEISRLTAEDVESLLLNPEIIRHRKKIEAVVQNAKSFITIQQEFGSFFRYLTTFFPHYPIYHHYDNSGEIPATDERATALAKDLKKRGFLFLGFKTVYAFLQSSGFYNDHLTNCYLRNQEVQRLTKISKKQYQLFLEAEPDELTLDSYLIKSENFVLMDEGKTRGVISLLSKKNNLEVMNLAIDTSFQGQGYGSVLLDFAKEYAITNNFQKLLIQTGTTTFDALKLYQRFGFRVVEVIPDYFTQHYKEPLFENGILLKDALRLELPL